MRRWFYKIWMCLNKDSSEAKQFKLLKVIIEEEILLI
jgi:hypothetical protein